MDSNYGLGAVLAKYPKLKPLYKEADAGLTQVTKLTHSLFSSHAPDLWMSDFVLFGTNSRTFALLSCVLREIPYNNHYIMRMAIRAQIETIAKLYYFIERPEKIDSVLAHTGPPSEGTNVNVLTLVDRVDNFLHKQDASITLRKDYDELSELVHPNAKSYLAGVKITDAEKRKFIFSSGLHDLTENEVRQYLYSVRYLSKLTCFLLKTFGEVTNSLKHTRTQTEH
ncbi:MAG: hypothetical protein WC792_04090 [Candidatus Micrarchaeia archaeon]